MYNICMKSKTIILSSPENENNGRGILTLFMEDELLKCKLRLYSAPKLNRYCKLGVYHNNNVYSSNFIERAGVYESSLVGDFDMDGDFYTALILTDQNNKMLMAGGTYAGYFFEDTDVFSNSDEFKIQNTKNENKYTNVCPNTDKIDAENEDKPNCEHCKYKEFFYSSNTPVDLHEIEGDTNNIIDDEKKSTILENKTDDNLYNFNSKTNNNNNQRIQSSDETSENVNNISENNDISLTFISQITPQFDYIFANYPLDEELNSRIDNGKFVKIHEGKDNYSIGAIYQGDEMQYICYAVARDYNEPAPEELGKHYQWLPLDPDDPLSAGYYIVYQSASDLKILEI